MSTRDKQKNYDDNNNAKLASSIESTVPSDQGDTHVR